MPPVVMMKVMARAMIPISPMIAVTLNSTSGAKNTGCMDAEEYDQEDEKGKKRRLIRYAESTAPLLL